MLFHNFNAIFELSNLENIYKHVSHIYSKIDMKANISKGAPRRPSWIYTYGCNERTVGQIWIKIDFQAHGDIPINIKALQFGFS